MAATLAPAVEQAFYSARVRLELRDVPDRDAWTDRLAERLVAGRLLAEHGEPVGARAQADGAVRHLLPSSRVLGVVIDSEIVGFVWLRIDGHTLAVHDLELAEPALGPFLRDGVLARAREDGCTHVDVGVIPGHASLEAFVQGGGFAPMATNMRLDLSVALDRADPLVRLDPMTEVEFDVFFRDEPVSYAAERAAAGEPPDLAERIAREQLAELLPDGRHSPEQHLFTARQDDEPVGHLWLATGRPTLFVYDVVVREGLRGRGLGREVMVAGEAWARGQGAIGVGLNVFAQNLAARRLYDGLGCRVTENHYLRAVDA